MPRFSADVCVYTQPYHLVDQASRGPVEQFLGLEAVVTPKHGLRQCTRQGGRLVHRAGLEFPGNDETMLNYSGGVRIWDCKFPI